MRVVSVDLRAVGIYLFAGMLVYLAGVYVEQLYYYLYIFLCLLPLLSGVQVLIALASLRCYQSFDTEQPVKGGTIGYRLRILGSPFFLPGGVRVRFAPIHPRLPDRIPDITLAFGGRGVIDEYYTIRCRYRGSYTVGIEYLEVRDVLGWLTLRKAATSRTFHVYPRVTDIPPLPTIDGSEAPSIVGGRGAGEPDPAMFEGLEGYREGASVRYVAWKKFLATGVPFLRQFGRSAQHGIRICIDLREGNGDAASELAVEDCSIETAVAVVKSLLDEHVPVTVTARGERDFVFRGSDASSFIDFYRATQDLLFHGSAPSPLELLGGGSEASAEERRTIILTHRADPAILTLATASSGREVGIVVNLTGLGARARARIAAFEESIREEGGTLFLVENADSLAEDAERWRTHYS